MGKNPRSGRREARSFSPRLLASSPNLCSTGCDQLFCNGYAVSIRDDSLFSSKLTIEVLEKVLNSRMMNYYAKLTSFQIEGDYQCYSEEFY